MNVRVEEHGDDDDLDADEQEEEEVNVNMNVGGMGMGVHTSSSSTTVRSSTTTVRTGGTTRVRAAAPVAAPAPAPACRVMSPGNFGEVVSAIEEESFGDGKLTVLGDAVEASCLSVKQVVKVLGVFDFGDDKIKALEKMAPRIYDPQNKFKIYSAFDFDSDKKKAKRILADVR